MNVFVLRVIPISKHSTPRSRRTGMLKTSQRPRENSIGLHSLNVAGVPKNPERCAEWFGHFRQRESRGAIDLVLLQETRVSVGEAGSQRSCAVPHGDSRTSPDAHDGQSPTQRVEGLQFY